MMRQIVSAAVGLCLSAGATLAESEQGVVVELFTSQGCSSCPPADEWLGQIADTPGVIGLALHVDYWDYIGWKDTFGQARFTERQKAYAHAMGEKMIYTPQIIVDGAAQVEGNQPAAVAQAISDAVSAQGSISLSLIRNGDQVLINAQSANPLPKPALVQLVKYTDMAVVDIDRGENAGLSMTYHHVVTSWQKVGDWAGTEPLKLSVAAGSGPVVVIIQKAGPSDILAAAQLK